MQDIIIVILAITTIVFAGLYFSVPSRLGVVSGFDHYNTEYFRNGLQFGDGTKIVEYGLRMDGRFRRDVSHEPHLRG